MKWKNLKRTNGGKAYLKTLLRQKQESDSSHQFGEKNKKFQRIMPDSKLSLVYGLRNEK